MSWVDDLGETRAVSNHNNFLCGACAKSMNNQPIAVFDVVMLAVLAVLAAAALYEREQLMVFAALLIFWRVGAVAHCCSLLVVRG